MHKKRSGNGVPESTWVIDQARSVRMYGYWQSSFPLECSRTDTEFSYLDRTSLVNKGLIKLENKTFCGTQRVRYKTTLPARKSIAAQDSVHLACPRS